MLASELHPHAWANATAALARSSQAILLMGSKGLGKTGLAIELAQWLFCEALRERHLSLPCGVCDDCRLMLARQHPDLQWLLIPRAIQSLLPWWGKMFLPETEDKEQIRLESWLNLRDFVHLSSTRGARRVLLINPAEAMNRATANALLKILEEPPEGLQFILIAHQPSRLPATIRSRCRMIEVRPPNQELALQWMHSQTQAPLSDCAQSLALAGGAPVMALRLIDKIDWIGTWREAIGETQGLAMMDWAENLAEPLRKTTAKASESGKKTSKKTRPKSDLAEEERKDAEASSESGEISLEESLDLFERLLVNQLYGIFNLPAPFGKAQADPISPLLLPKLFAIYDEIIYFRRRLMFTLNPQQVFERLLLQWLQLNRGGTS